MTHLFHKPFLCLGLLLVTLSVASEAQSIGISPAIINEKFTPGQTLTFPVSVANTGSAPLYLKTLSSDLWFEPETNERTLLPAGTHERSAANWVSFVPQELTVPPKSSSVVNVVVTPRGSAAGGYYAVLFFESRPELAEEATEKKAAVYANFRVGALLLLTARGTEQYHVNISEFKVTPPDRTHNLSAEFRVDNQSNTHIMPQVKLAVVDSGKHLVGKADGDLVRFMPGQKNTFRISYPGTLNPGDYTAIVTIVHEGGQVVTRELPFQVSKNQ
jgi:hypothetical protein